MSDSVNSRSISSSGCTDHNRQVVQPASGSFSPRTAVHSDTTSSSSPTYRDYLMVLFAENDKPKVDGLLLDPGDDAVYRCWCCPDCMLDGRAQSPRTKSRRRKSSCSSTPSPRKVKLNLGDPSAAVNGGLASPQHHHHHHNGDSAGSSATNGCTTDMAAPAFSSQSAPGTPSVLENGDVMEADDGGTDGELVSHGDDVDGDSSLVISADVEDEKKADLFVEAFVCNNRLDHLIQVLGYHPAYLKSLKDTQYYLIKGPGPLRYEERNYIAIMAAARHQCAYLVNMQINEFLANQGDKEWLNGVDHVPRRLQKLQEINKILAHRPWLLKKDHILSLQADGWSMSELMHAIVILSHFHALSSFVYGCGIAPETDHHNGHTYTPTSPSPLPSSPSPPQSANHAPPSPKHHHHHHHHSHNTTPSTTPRSNSSSGTGCHTPVSRCDSGCGSGKYEGSRNGDVLSPTSELLNGGIEALMARMKKLDEVGGEEISPEEQVLRFQKVESQYAELPVGSCKPSPRDEILQFVLDPDFAYQDFFTPNKPSDIPTFRAQDLSWEEHGQPVANNLYDNIGTLLDDKFNTSANLTYFTMGDNQDVDTSSFRRAIWNYIHCIYGIRHDDYDYCEVNHLLERDLKSYIKTVTCYPERVTKEDYDGFMSEFKHSEKVHVNLMVLEARMQAELLYALRAIMKVM